MKAPLRLTAHEVRSVDAILRQFTERAMHKRPFSLDQMLSGWHSFVEKVERGYDDSIYEYTNDLSTRDLLEEILLKASHSLRRKLMEAIGPYDDRFNEATLGSKRPVAPGVKQDAASWWFRVPKSVAGELEEDLRAEGLLQR